MRDAVIDEQALCQLRERSRDDIGPDDARAVDSRSHHEVREAPGSNYVAWSWSIDDNGVRWSLIGTIDCLAP